MKSWTCMLTVLLIMLTSTLGMAQGIPADDMVTPRLGFAVAAPENPKEGNRVEMYEMQDVYSYVMMEYYSGAVFEVTGLGGELVQVRAGEGAASVTGYICAKDLRYGERAAREVPLCYAILEFGEECAIYSDMSEERREIGRTDTIQAYPVCGRNISNWVQVFEPSGMEGGDEGFVRLHGRILGNFREEPYTYAVPPLENELTREEAYEQAIQYLLERREVGNSFVDMLPEYFRSEEGLRSMKADIRLWKHRGGTVTWNVSLEDPQCAENNISVEMLPTGELVAISRGNG